jgi:hypothetical protein
MELCKDEGVDARMITYLSCPVDDIKDITHSCQEFMGNFFQPVLDNWWRQSSLDIPTWWHLGGGQHLGDHGMDRTGNEGNSDEC